MQHNLLAVCFVDCFDVTLGGHCSVQRPGALRVVDVSSFKYFHVITWAMQFWRFEDNKHGSAELLESYIT